MHGPYLRLVDNSSGNFAKFTAIRRASSFLVRRDLTVRGDSPRHPVSLSVGARAAR
jgi:hypothetical protein